MYGKFSFDILLASLNLDLVAVLTFAKKNLKYFLHHPFWDLLLELKFGRKFKHILTYLKKFKQQI